MKKIGLVLAAAGVASAVFASSAHALTTTLDFGNFTGFGSFPGSTQTGLSSLSYTLFPGVTLTLTPAVTNSAHVIQPVNLSDPATLGRTRNLPTGHPNEVNSGGIGEKKTSTDGVHDINGGLTFGELVEFHFSHAVRLVSIRFSRVDSNDFFDFWSGGTFQFTSATPMPVAVYSFLPTTIGSYFGIGTVKPFSDFKIRAITVSSVPLPPAILLFATGLLGVGALGRRRSKSK